MIKIVGSRRPSGSYEYESTIMELGGSTRWKSAFESQDEMTSTMNAILARQKRDHDVRLFMSDIHAGGHYFFDVDLTEEQAESLGWQKRPDGEVSIAVKQAIKPAPRILQRLPRQQMRYS
jgi:hypothetical protein